jgi:hypothetical protein
VQRVLDGLRCLATNMEQTGDLGESERDHAATARGHGRAIY